MATPALLMRTSSMSTSLTASWICEALVTSRVKGVTRLSECCSTPRVPAYTFLAPRRSASSRSARPIPRFAPVTKIVLFAMFISNVLPSLTTVPLSRKIRALFNDWCAGVVKPAEGAGSVRQNSVVSPHVRVVHDQVEPLVRERCLLPSRRRPAAYLSWKEQRNNRRKHNFWKGNDLI